LGWAYTHAYALTDDAYYGEIAQRTCDWMLREMRTPEGAFASALDADTPEGEGYYYTWTEREIYEILPRDEADLFCKVYEIQPEGNYHDEATHRPTGRNIPHLAKPIEQHAEELNLDPDDLHERLADIRARLLVARQTRHAPRRDDKVLTDWNGLAIWALAYAADVFEDAGERYAQAAIEAGEFLWQSLRDSNGRLLHRYREGEASIPAYLPDYAFYGMGLMELYSLTLERKWLERAVEIADQMIERFHDAEHGGFFTTDSAHDLLIMSVKSYQDRVMPSGNGGAVQFLATLSTALAIDDPQRSERYAQLAADTLDSCWAILRRAPAAGDSLLYGYLLLEGDLMEAPELEMPEEAFGEADEQEGPVRVDFLPQPEGLLVLFQIEEGWHINAGYPQEGRVPTTIEVSTDLPLQIGEPIWMPPQRIKSGSEPIEVYYEQAAAILPVTAIETSEPMDGYVRILVRYQPCTETECGLPVERVYLMPLSLRPQE
ncbi:MAG: protein-disulfide reductase DsbD family protein, partial [Fimbriimonadales bacterium]|nr:protein-disulfide reductase DsbD family protein [Fimbriimonadales bacterium]